jgi:diguanylate cyclase (GGDEF)-like protein
MTATTALIAACAALAVVALALLLHGRRLARALERAEAESRRNRRLADFDSLTGLHNKRYFDETLAREVARARRYGRALALVIADVDDFKAINDRFGHLAGDAVLAEVGARVREVVRSADIACRVGGDEIAVILPESSAADAERLYARLQRTVAAHPVAGAGYIEVSAGITELLEGDDATTCFDRADKALYRAKELGKGRAVIAPETSRPPGTASSR